AMTDEAALARCIEVGGDDFLTKPFSHTLLHAKIMAMERIRDLHREVNSLYTRMQRDEEIAEQVFSGAVLADNLTLDCIRTSIRSADTFSGDVFLTAHAPSGDLHVLLGDFTGHGLAAALGALPTAEVFRTMTAKGFSGPQILSSINRKLCNLLPTGMFMGVEFVSIDQELSQISICNCGMPDVLLLDRDGTVRERVSSRGFPLGISTTFSIDDFFIRIPINSGERVMLISDGVTEAQNRDKELFGQARLEATIDASRGQASALDAIDAALDAFCQDAPQADDISLAEVPCTPAVLPPRAKHTEHPVLPATAGVEQRLPHRKEWDYALTLHASRLRDVDPVPLLINQIQELEGAHVDR
ncbi:MAG: SpoIIE family protein phosphatase, partial [Gammaproteobacteria bacterium]|nr:SpoIIE family protein phosphatase [Gammaproteobacteria bacterium]